MRLTLPDATWRTTILIAALVASFQFGWLRVRYFAPVAMLLFAASIVWSRGKMPRRTLQWQATGMALLVVLTVGGARMLDDPLFRWLPTAAAFVLSGVWLHAWLRTDALDDQTDPGTGSALAVLSMLLVVFVGGELLFSPAGPRIIDETWNLLQGDLLARGQLTGTYPAGQESMHALSLGAFADGRFVSQYPLGWPAILAWPSQWHVERFVGPLLGVASAIGAGLLAKREAGPRAGLLAAVLVGVSPIFAVSSWSYLSHVVSAAMVIFAGLLIEIGLTTRGRRAVAGLLAGGLCGGVLFSIRPLTAAAFGCVALLRVLWHFRRGHVGATLATVGLLTLGFALPAGLVFATNARMSGSWHAFGYAFVNGPLNDLGFGMRGYRLWTPEGVYAEEATLFTPMMGFGFTVAGALEMLATFLPLGLTLLLVPGAGNTSSRTLRWWGAGIAMVVIVHGFWFYRAARFYYDAVPLLAALTAVLIVRHDVLRRRWRTIGLQLGLIGAGAVAGRGWMDYQWTRSFVPALRQIEALGEGETKVVLSVRATGDRSASFHALYFLNSPRYDGKFVVIRDVGVSGDSLSVLYPGAARYRIYCDPCSEEKLALYPKPTIERF